MAMTDSSNIMDLSSRPRRIRHFSGKNYDGEGDKSLELRGILEVLSAYQDYDGGINCCMCGKLYKSKVCFIKHLWEHSVYWDLFPGDKNHERVLAIQAALILYAGHMGISMQDAERMMDLLVTSPSIHETNYPLTPKKDVRKKVLKFHETTYPKTPEKDSSKTLQSLLGNMDPATPEKDVNDNLPSANNNLYPLTPLSSVSSNLYPSTPIKETSPGYPNFHRSTYPATPKKAPSKRSSLKMPKMSRKKLRLVLE